MENNLMVFTNEQFGDVRTVFKDGKICFIAVDCCNALGIVNPSKALANFDDDEKAEVTIGYTSSNGVEQRRNVLAVTEAGLYRLVFMSRKPNAKQFQRWIFHVVIPSIRERGYYAALKVVEDSKPVGNPDFPPELSKLWAGVKTGEALVEAAKLTTDRRFREAIVRKAVYILTGGELTPSLPSHVEEIEWDED